jgi:hypothetical protein
VSAAEVDNVRRVLAASDKALAEGSARSLSIQVDRRAGGRAGGRHRRPRGANEKFRPRQTLRNFVFLAGGALAAAPAVLTLTITAVAASDMISERVAILQGLDKITARVSQIEAPVGKTVTFGGLAITVRDCEKNPPEDQPESAAFLQIDEVRPGEENIRRFSGWMFAQSPALSSLENPVYDVILLDCRGAKGSPPASSGSDAGK